MSLVRHPADAPASRKPRGLFTSAAAAAGLSVLCGCGGLASAASPVYYFSDCQAGAAAACTAGRNANAGTSASAPKQDLKGFNVNALPAGTRLLFAKGGAWTNFNVVLRNLNVTPDNPLVFDSYAPSWGGTSPPWIKAGGSFYAFQFGTYGDTANDGGYTIRNLLLDGLGASGAWGVHLRNDARNVTLENLEITRFDIGVHSQDSGPVGNTFLTVRNSNIHRNAEHGFLGHALGLLLEGNTFAYNNMDGGPREHGVYLGGRGRNGIVRNNTFLNNSAPGGVCNGGNFTVHGQWDGLLVEGNRVYQDAAAGGCYGISINPGYNSAEWFRNVVIRGNVVVNVGGCGICVTSAPGALIEGNRIVNNQATYQTGILVPDRATGPGDDADTAAVVRHNTVYFSQAGEGSTGVSARAGRDLQVASNLIYFGARSHATHHCFSHRDRTDYAAFDGNLCHHAAGNGSWSPAHRTLAAAQAAAFDTRGLGSDPMFSAQPTNANQWRCQLDSKSPAVNAAQPGPNASPPGPPSSTGADIGACERGAN